MIHKTLFNATLVEGYSFRNTIAMIKVETDEVTMVVSSVGIIIKFVNKGQHGVYDIFINAESLSSYNYNIVDHTEYPITVNTTELLNTTKGVGRKDGLNIYWLENYAKISIQPLKHGKDLGRSTASFVNIINREYIKYELHNSYTGNEPNIKIQSKEFSDACSQACALRCSYVEIQGCSNYFIFKGILSDGTCGMISRTMSQQIKGKIEQIQHKDDMLHEKISTQNSSIKGSLELNVIKNEDLKIVKIPISTIKTFCKLHNISPGGTLLKFTFSATKPMKIESPISSYGEYKVYLRNPIN